MGEMLIALIVVLGTVRVDVDCTLGPIDLPHTRERCRRTLVPCRAARIIEHYCTSILRYLSLVVTHGHLFLQVFYKCDADLGSLVSAKDVRQKRCSHLHLHLCAQAARLSCVRIGGGLHVPFLKPL